MNNIDIRLIYEINEAKSRLEFAIKEAEYQLTSVKKRLESLQHDLVFYIASLVAPFVLILILSPITNLLISSLNPLNYLLGLLFQMFSSVLACVYIIFFPANLYYLVNTILLIKKNKECESMDVLPPAILGTYKGNRPPQEPSFRSEYIKLTFVLARYYLYMEKIDDLHKKITSGACSMTVGQLRSELLQIVYYEDICPANTFSSNMVKKTRQKTKFIFLGVIILVIVLIIVILG